MRIFFSGVGGSGVSAIAGFIAERGWQVAGSDRLFDMQPGHPLRKIFEGMGVSVFPQDGSGMTLSTDLAVFSTAVEKDNPDYVKARALNIPVKTRPEYLAELVSGFKTVAVAGTSGKSTVSGMLAFLMERLGLGPNFIGGGRVKQFRTPVSPGNYLSGHSDILVIEACESDGTIVDYLPAFSIIGNLSLDHHSLEETSRMFEALSINTSGPVIVGGDDRNLARCSFERAIRFSIESEGQYRAEEIEYFGLLTRFSVKGVSFSLSLPGKHNLYNALACIALLSEMGVALENISAALPEFTGIERRFDIHLNDGRFLVIDDYAHNPHKISSLMQTVSALAKSVCYIFQPHGYGPTRLMLQGYIETFTSCMRESDMLVLLPIYYAGGTAAKDISSQDIARGVAEAGKQVVLCEDRDEVLKRAELWHTYVVFGARDDTLSDFAGAIASRLSVR